MVSLRRSKKEGGNGIKVKLYKILDVVLIFTNDKELMTGGTMTKLWIIFSLRFKMTVLSNFKDNYC